MALGDFIQNYMDTSHPLPNAPLSKNTATTTRPRLNTTKQKGRNPRYWINMDDETFKKAKHEMLGRVDRINTLTARI